MNSRFWFWFNTTMALVNLGCVWLDLHVGHIGMAVFNGLVAAGCVVFCVVNWRTK